MQLNKTLFLVLSTSTFQILIIQYKILMSLEERNKAFEILAKMAFFFGGGGGSIFENMQGGRIAYELLTEVSHV